jgi:hypothetical protein
VDEQKPRLHFRLARLSIDSDVHPNVFRHPSSSSTRAKSRALYSCERAESGELGE